VSVIANQFVIRQVDPHSNQFMYSANLWDVARRCGFWNEALGPLDFLLTYAPKRAHSPYATRRVWRVFNLVAPSLAIPAETDSYASNYPFSVKPEKILSPQDVMDIQRDHYEGTVYDLTQGLAAGPYGDPNRFDMTPVDGLTFEQLIQGSYERSISLFRTSYSFVATPRKNVPDILALMWFGQYAPSSTSYAPFYVSSQVVPPTHSR
jgi:dipeptidase